MTTFPEISNKNILNPDIELIVMPLASNIKLLVFDIDGVLTNGKFRQIPGSYLCFDLYRVMKVHLLPRDS